MKTNQGLTIDDIHTLLHNPEEFELNSNNMAQVYTLMLNLSDLFKKHTT